MHYCERQYLWEQLTKAEQTKANSRDFPKWHTAGDGADVPLSALAGQFVDALRHVGGDATLQKYAERNRLLFQLDLRKSTLKAVDLTRTHVLEVHAAGHPEQLWETHEDF